MNDFDAHLHFKTGLCGILMHDSSIIPIIPAFNLNRVASQTDCFGIEARHSQFDELFCLIKILSRID